MPFAPQFCVEGFQRDQPELLKSLKRHDAQRQSTKKPSSSRALNAGSSGACRSPTTRLAFLSERPAAHCAGQLVELGAFGLQSEVEQLKRDKLLLLKEVMRLRNQQVETSGEPLIVRGTTTSHASKIA